MVINMKAWKIILVIAIVSVIFIALIPWVTLLIGGYALPNPNAPEITYKEFPICLEYEIDNKNVRVEDVLVCKFDGFGFDEGRGEKFRKWEASLKSGNNRITLLENDNIEIYYFPVKEESRLPGVFMGDIEYYSGGVGDTFPDAWYTADFDDKTVNDYIISAEEMEEKYSLRLVKWECAPPIENNFK